MNTDRPSCEEMKYAPLCYQNWWQSDGDLSESTVYEFPVFSDSRVYGGILRGFGPHTLLNLFPRLTQQHFTEVLPMLLLRIRWNLRLQAMGNWNPKTNDDSYHGGEVQDEVAALLSLQFGRRFKADHANREFKAGEDPLGRPISGPGPRRSVGFFSDPNHRMIPELFESCTLTEETPLANIVRLSPKDATVLVKVARQYQEGIWIAEADPNLGWLLLVTAIETAAQSWKQTIAPPAELLESSDLGKRILEIPSIFGQTEIFSELAEILAPLVGSTRKFVDFLLEYLPDEPSVRPKPFAQVDWLKTAIEKSFKKIYACRSKALHEGKPFPLPMIRTPQVQGENVEERPSCSSIRFGQNTWNSEDIPMHLHIFEYIVRGALLSWWKNMQLTYPLPVDYPVS